MKLIVTDNFSANPEYDHTSQIDEYSLQQIGKLISEGYYAGIDNPPGLDWELKKDRPEDDSHDFCDDHEKMEDFLKLSKEEFLASYNYVTELEYDLTKQRVENEAQE